MANGNTRGRHGWDGPVEIITPGSVKAENDMVTLVALIQDSAPDKSGTLKRDLSLRRGNWKLLKKPRRGFRGIIRNSYAYIQDQGGTIPERYPRGSILHDDFGVISDTVIGNVPQSQERKAMGWGGPVGGPHQTFAKKAAAAEIPAQDYVNKGFRRWMKARGHDGPTVAWVESEERLGRQKLRRRRGLGLTRHRGAG